MNLPTPVPGLVIRYSFLWSMEAQEGRDEAREDRPAAIVVATRKVDGDLMVIAAPIAALSPSDSATSLEVPREVARSLGLDGDRQWLRLDGLNRFAWPGFDLRAVPGTESCAYGMLPEELYSAMRQAILDRQRSRKVTQR